MSIVEAVAKSILREHKRVDSWFISYYGMNLYRGCTHSCVYCDGRAEKYCDGEFAKTSQEGQCNENLTRRTFWFSSLGNRPFLVYTLTSICGSISILALSFLWPLWP